MHSIELPSYLEQSESVKDRFDRLKQRPVVLEVKGLSREFDTPHGPVTALNDINFKTHRREFVCVIGPSGCGKSTLIRILAGLETDGDQRLDRRIFVLNAQTDRIAGDNALGFKAAQALMHAAARKTGMAGERHQALA